jgi:putative tryptophan/tyrosine transport system substrate-binding protein
MRRIPRSRHIGYDRFSDGLREPYSLTALIFSGDSFEHAWSGKGTKPLARYRAAVSTPRGQPSVTYFTKRSGSQWKDSSALKVLFLRKPKNRQPPVAAVQCAKDSTGGWGRGPLCSCAATALWHSRYAPETGLVVLTLRLVVRDPKRSFKGSSTEPHHKVLGSSFRSRGPSREGHMRRREFIAFIGAGVMLPLSARAQQSTKVYRIAIVHPSWPVAELTESSSNRFWRELFLEIRRLGYVEGKNLVIERYSGGGRADLYPKLARDVATSNPNLILAFTSRMVVPLQEATSTIPIVAMTSDPVNRGFVASMSRLAGNHTGVSVDAGLEIWGKRLELFREVVPTISKLAILGLRQNPDAASMQAAAEKAGIAVVGPSFLEDQSEAEYRRVFAFMSQEGADALFVDSSPDLIMKARLIGDLAKKYRLPAESGSGRLC